MAKQDEYVRITLRLPPDLHLRLLEHAGAGSLNAEIVARLQSSMNPPPIYGDDVPMEELFIRISRDAAKNAVAEFADRLSAEIARVEKLRAK